MSLIKEFYEEEIYANAAKNPSPLPNGTQVGPAANPDFKSDQWMDWNFGSLVKAIDRG
jgi:hypothetical protein